MSVVSIQVPTSLHAKLLELAEEEGISVEQFAATAIAEKMAALMTETYLRARAQRGSREQYDAALAQVPDVEPEDYDKLPNA